VKDPDFVYITFIAATPEKVWEGLTGNDFIAKYWSGHQSKTDWKTGSPVTMYPFVGWGMDFTSIVDASRYSGVRFRVRGSLTAGCTISLVLGDPPHSMTPPFGTCPSACYAGGKTFLPTATLTDVTIPFTDLSPGDPPTGVNPARLIAVQWLINFIATDNPTGCSAQLMMDDVRFFP